MQLEGGKRGVGRARALRSEVSIRRIIAIVPTLNEEAPSGRWCRLRAECDRVVVSDGGSRDATVEVAQDAGAEVVQGEAGRGRSGGGWPWRGRPTTGATCCGSSMPTRGSHRARARLRWAAARARWGCCPVRIGSNDPRVQFTAWWMNQRALRAGLHRGHGPVVPSEPVGGGGRGPGRRRPGRPDPRGSLGSQPRGSRPSGWRPRPGGGSWRARGGPSRGCGRCGRPTGWVCRPDWRPGYRPIPVAGVGPRARRTHGGAPAAAPSRAACPGAAHQARARPGDRAPGALDGRRGADHLDVGAQQQADAIVELDGRAPSGASSAIATRASSLPPLRVTDSTTTPGPSQSSGSPSRMSAPESAIRRSTQPPRSSRLGATLSMAGRPPASSTSKASGARTTSSPVRRITERVPAAAPSDRLSSAMTVFTSRTSRDSTEIPAPRSSVVRPWARRSSRR